MKEKISNNCYKGELITNPMDLIRLAEERKAVYHKNWGIKPASVFLAMQTKSVLDSIRYKKFYFVIH